MASSSQNTAQQSQSAPWAPAQPGLLNILARLPSGSPSGAQNTAANNLVNSATGLPNFGGAAGGVTAGLLGGDPTGLLGSTNSWLSSVLGPIASANLDPTKTPGMQGVLDTIRSDVSNNINGTFAGAGRDLSPANSQAVARGIAQGEAAPLLGQYNSNVANTINAGSQLFGANYNTAGAIAGNEQAGLGAAAQQPGIAMSPALAQLQAASTKYNLPLANLSGIESLMLPIAGLGGQSSGTSQGTYTPSPYSMAMQGLGLGGNTIGGGLYSSGMNRLGSMFG